MNLKKIIVVAIAAIMSLSTMVVVSADDTATYSCDFTQLIKDSADTMYGTETDTYVLDEYTTAILTYEGTYVSADGTVYLKSSKYGKAAYTRGSYIEFTAPADGTVEYTGYKINYSIDPADYTGNSSNGSISLEAGQTLRVSPRQEDSYIRTFTFTATATEEPTPVPASVVKESTDTYYYDESEGIAVAENSSNIPDPEDVIKLKGFSWKISANDETITGIKISNSYTNEQEQSKDVTIAPGSTVVVGAFAITTEGSDMSNMESANWTLTVDKGDGNYVKLD